MHRISTGVARKELSDTVSRAAYGGARVVITRHGKDIAAVVPIADLDLLREIENLIDERAARKALRAGKKSGMISLAGLRASLIKSRGD